MTQIRTSSKDRILSAAADVAREAGAGNLSLEAVAARAGVSKGGLLYNFPTKAALMRALVESFLTRFETELDAATQGPGARDGLLEAYIKLSAIECDETRPGAAGVLAAIAEDPDFLKPIAAFKRRLLDRLKDDTPDVETLLLVYLALEGMRSMKLFDSDVLTHEEREQAIAAMLKRVTQTC
ncbi:MAG: TetR/AcrR family transcriptional regulator [Rhizobiaceae bacterium]|nr:TetR/AcrR family transcriptional regulator [Rhizobiaceae bacterium]